MLYFKTSFSALLLCIHGLLGAANTCMRLPFMGTGALTEEDRLHERFITLLRTNDAAGVKDILQEKPSFLVEKFKGNLMPLHVLVSSEHFGGHDPREMLNVFKEIIDLHMPTHSDAWHHTSGRSFWSVRANVNSRWYRYLCLGGEGQATYRKLMYTPIELAMCYKSLKTLAAIAQHVPIASFIISNPDFDAEYALYAAMLTPAQKRDNALIEKIILSFGVKGMDLLHKHGIVYEPLSGYSGQAAPTPFEIFASAHPDKKESVAHLKRPAAPGSPIRWWHKSPESPEAARSS